MNFKLGTIGIFELGEMIVKKLHENGVTEKSELIVRLNKEEFEKVDEDLFYRNRKNEDEEFIPSEGEIDINIDSLKIIIITKEKEES